MDSSTIWCQPFPVAIPTFPAKRRRREILQPVGENVPKHMPQHLPPFPPAHTYKRTQPSRRVKKIAVAPTSHMTASKSVQESLAILEGLNSSRKRPRSSDHIEQGILADESNPAVTGAPHRVINPNSGHVRALPREEKILLGVPVLPDT